MNVQLFSINHFTSRSAFVLSIPLILSGFTHIWNPVGFPSIHDDEGHYMKRALNFLEVLDPQSNIIRYDHPYFGWIFLAGIFVLTGYPDSLNPSDNGEIFSIEILYFLPRVLMGLIAVFDTFLVYKIADLRYDRKAAFIAALLFAVMPLSSLTRGILLDSIMLPFLLLSVLFAHFPRNLTKRKEKLGNNHCSAKNMKMVSLTILSGAFLGIAIFTKIPAFVMIPLIAFTIYCNTNKNYRMLGLWLIPVVLIPSLWPAYSVSLGEFPEWLDGVSWQATERVDRSLLSSVYAIFLLDPVLFMMGIGGLVLLIVRRDFFLFLWVLSFMILYYSIGWIQQFHWIPLIPPICIAGGKLLAWLEDNTRKIRTEIIKQSLSIAIVLAVVLYGFAITMLLVTMNLNSTYFQVAAFIVKYLQDGNTENEEQITIVGNRWWARFGWIPQYVFSENVDFNRFFIEGSEDTNKAILVVDSQFAQFMSSNNQANNKIVKEVSKLQDQATTIAVFSHDIAPAKATQFPYTGTAHETKLDKIIIKANY